MTKFYLNLVLLVLVIFLFQPVQAQPISEKLYSHYLTGTISYDQYLEYTALNIVAPESVPEKYRRQPGDRPQKSGTFIVQELKQNWQRLSPTTQRLLSGYLDRRALPFSVTSPSGRFRIHYTLEGRDAVNPSDNNKNGVPDYVDNTARYFDYINHLLVDSLKYAAPPADSGGIGKEFDVYLVQLSIWYGVTYLEETVPGNPNAYSCYMQIENDYAGFPTPPEQSLMVTSAHEYFHVVQVGYTYRDEDVFFMEMCSTWMEDFAHDQVNDYLNYLPSFFSDINLPFSYIDENYEYASALWNHMIVKKFGADVIRKIWERIPAENALTSIRHQLPQSGTTFDTELASFGLWNYFTGSRCDTVNFYPDGCLYPEVESDKYIEDATQDTSFEASMSKLSSSFFQFNEQLHNLAIGIIVTNFDIPSKNSYGNYDPTDKISFSLDFISLPDQDTSAVASFIRLNKLVKISPFHGVRFNISEKDKWSATAVVFETTGDYSICQFFPATPPDVDMEEEFIINIFPNPYLISANTEPLYISYYTTEKDLGDLNIYSADGRLMHTQTVNTNIRFSDDLEWDGKDQNGNHVASGVYLAVLRIGKQVDTKKFAVIR